MAFITLVEVRDMIAMTLAVGFIFMHLFRKPQSDDPVENLRNQKAWHSQLLFSMALVAPPLILHELGHKFLAMSMGFSATFKAAYFWLGLGVLLKLVSFPFLIIVPAFVSIIGQATPLQNSLIAFAGPGVNLALWVLSMLVLKLASLKRGAQVFWSYFKIINLFLFVFNMLPIPGFDGFQVYLGLWQSFV